MSATPAKAVEYSERVFTQEEGGESYTVVERDQNGVKKRCAIGLTGVSKSNMSGFLKQARAALDMEFAK